MTQKSEVLKYLKNKGGLTQRKASQLLGVERLAAVVCDLRNEGEPIATYMITVPTRYGNKKTQVAEYRYTGVE